MARAFGLSRAVTAREQLIKTHPAGAIQPLPPGAPDTRTAAQLGFADSDPITADDLDAVVRWQSGPDLGPWSGRPVRLQFQLRSTRVYAFQFLD